MSPTPQHAATGAFVVSMRGEIGGYTSPAHPSWHPAAKSTRRFLLFSSRRQEIFRRTLAEEWRVPPYNVRFTVDARTDNGILLEYSGFAATKRAANWIVESAKRLRMTRTFDNDSPAGVQTGHLKQYRPIRILPHKTAQKLLGFTGFSGTAIAIGKHRIQKYHIYGL